jgi:hypothetical protein
MKRQLTGATHMTDKQHICQIKDVGKEEVSLPHDIHVTKKQKNGNLKQKMTSKLTRNFIGK